MKKWFLGICFLVLIGYIWANPFSEGPMMAAPSKPTIETVLQNRESHLTRLEHLKRLYYFKEFVEVAYELRVPRGKRVPESMIPSLLKKAIVATEDRRFYEHFGIDFIGVLRAFFTNTIAGETLQGGSTISQQLVKNLFLTEDRTWERKAEEAVMAVLLEQYFSKEEILTMYLNSIYFGNHYTGLDEAAHGYFKEVPKRLNLAQCALLAGLPQAPTYYNPVENPEGARERRTTVLFLMVQQGIVTMQEAHSANLEPLIVSRGEE